MSGLAREGSDPDRDGLSQTGRALLALRDLILQGELGPGDRLVETALVERLGASRTPVRTALARLEGEGLVAAAPGGGYVVRAFDERDMIDAIEIRGTIEGLAARLVSERGLTPVRLAALRALIAEIDVIAATSDVTGDVLSRYARLNGQLHDQLIDAAESSAISRQYELAVALPFASPSGLVMAQALSPASRKLLHVAHDQHRCLIDAIVGREGARAEAIAREHSRLAVRNIRLALAHPAGRELVPGGVLLRSGRRDG